MSRATRLTADAASLARDRDSEPTQEQHFDAEEGEQLGRAQHLVVCLGYAQLRLWLLRLLRLLGRSDWRGGRGERIECGTPGRRAALRHRRTRHGEKDERDGDRGQRAACATVSDSRRGAVSGQASITLTFHLSPQGPFDSFGVHFYEPLCWARLPGGGPHEEVGGATLASPALPGTPQLASRKDDHSSVTCLEADWVI
jgi:hypothetical protein